LQKICTFIIAATEKKGISDGEIKTPHGMRKMMGETAKRHKYF
jgi:hypothetical protein